MAAVSHYIHLAKGLLSMNQVAPIIRHDATYQDVIDAPANMVAELVRGALHLHPRPTSRHGFAGSVLGMKLGSTFQLGGEGLGGWWIIDEPELHLDENVLVPDIAGWRRERMPEFPDTAAFDLAPDWVCEVLSRSTRQFDLVEKRTLYGEAGVSHLWFVDPVARTLEAFANQDGSWTLIAALKDDDKVSVAPFDAIEFELSALWPD
ncbi:Uma2 family endonuclease [Cognatiyoonia sp. IB215182]|uniref:Uma2 family endonuclease n=1 Tax=Cognatiyoonia sp. IB215182 TaxID=3097353 RepID=UPI002A163C45|nr:Uma2 family endonuclease [Cognatiyoonia sp. IB215182]MDX8355797.1 Uma2 family endonuclease [Cognatiyoonia sp. IB215182]